MVRDDVILDLIEMPGHGLLIGFLDGFLHGQPIGVDTLHEGGEVIGDLFLAVTEFD